MTMPRILAALLYTALFAAAPALAADDTVMRAMKDELARSMKKLQLEQLQKPYFISYRALDTSFCNVSAMFGALMGNQICDAASPDSLTRGASVDVRVGDYARDNTNFFAPISVGGVARLVSVGGTQMPLDDNYDEIRRQFWLATDSSYKTALDMFAKKSAALEHRTRPDNVPDFSHEPVVTLEESEPATPWTRQEAESLVKSLSAVFRQTPGIDGSEVRLSGQKWTLRYVNSEGTSFIRRGALLTLQIAADTQAVNGMPLADYEVAYARSLSTLPAREELLKRVRVLADRLTAQRKAATLDRYTGPVLFEGEAAAELFYQGLGGSLPGAPRTVVEDARMDGVYNSNGGLATKTGTRILPEFISVKDAPAATDFKGQALLGGYAVDDEGVKAGETSLVENGILKTLLHSRALIPNTTNSTASRRGFQTSPSNLIFSASKALTPEQLKAELIGLVKQRNLEFGVLVRRIGNQQLSIVLSRSRTLVFISSSNAGGLQIEPLREAYKVFPDGREELIGNLNLTGLNLGDFRNIVAVSEPSTVYTAPMRILTRAPVTQVALFQAAGPVVVSANVPSMLFEDINLERPTGDVPILPFSPHPSFDK